MIFVSLALAAIAVGAWTLSYRRSAQPCRDPDFFVALAQLDDDAPGRDRRAAEVIEAKHHLEARAAWPSGLLGVVTAMAALFLVQDIFFPWQGPRLEWISIELVVIAFCSAGWMGWCVRRASRNAVRQSRVYRRTGN